jgi:hypothetical protein
MIFEDDLASITAEEEDGKNGQGALRSFRGATSSVCQVTNKFI